jgi:hypothetical protein
MPDFLAEVLTWPSNYANTLAVETAMNLHLPPTVMLIDERQPSEGWSSADKKLAVAWTILQRETCRECGQPLWICRSSNRQLQFSVRTDTCYATAAVKKWQNSSRGKKLKDGEYPYVVPFTIDKSPLPTRLEYLKEISDD